MEDSSVQGDQERGQPLYLRVRDTTAACRHLQMCHPYVSEERPSATPSGLCLREVAGILIRDKRQLQYKGRAIVGAAFFYSSRSK